jgi:ribosomal protein S18 acetylase RimI-like enzyme
MILGVDTLSPDGVVEEFQERWRRSDLPDKMPQPIVVANGPVVELILIAVYRQHQRKGHATRALQMLTTLCDENELTITLTARQMDESSLSSYADGCPPALSTDQLVAWYKQHGFIDTTFPGNDTRSMFRKPRTHMEPAPDV